MIISRARKRDAENFRSYLTLSAKIFLFIIFIVSACLVSSKIKTYFPIQEVKVFGIQHADQKSLQQSLMPLVNRGFFGVDVDSIKDQLLQSPWIANAVVQRVWPNQVVITVIEKIPMARWNNSSLMSSNGDLFSPDPASYPDGLPQLLGPEDQHMQIMAYYKKLNSLLAPLHFKIATLELTHENSWALTCDNGIKVSAGYKDVLTRVSHFVKVYPKIIGNRYADVEYIDLRYPNGLAVRWKTVS